MERRVREKGIEQNERLLLDINIQWWYINERAVGVVVCSKRVMSFGKATEEETRSKEVWDGTIKRNIKGLQASTPGGVKKRKISLFGVMSQDWIRSGSSQGLDANNCRQGRNEVGWSETGYPRNASAR